MEIYDHHGVICKLNANEAVNLRKFLLENGRKHGIEIVVGHGMVTFKSATIGLSFTEDLSGQGR